MGEKITSFLASSEGGDNPEASTLSTKSLLADVSISGGEDFVINDTVNDNQEGRIALKNFHRSTVCLTLATPFAHFKSDIPSASMIDRAIADSMNKRSGQSPHNVVGGGGFNTNSAANDVNENGVNIHGENSNGVNNSTSPAFYANYLNDDGSINPRQNLDNDLSDNNHNNDNHNDNNDNSNNDDNQGTSTEFAAEPDDESDGVQVNAGGGGYSVTEIDGVDGEEGLGIIVRQRTGLLDSIFLSLPHSLFLVHTPTLFHTLFSYPHSLPLFFPFSHSSSLPLTLTLPPSPHPLSPSPPF